MLIILKKEIEKKMSSINNNPTWITKGKTLKELIAELITFENQDLEVRISLDDGATNHPISLVGKYGKFAVLVNCENVID